MDCKLHLLFHHIAVLDACQRCKLGGCKPLLLCDMSAGISREQMHSLNRHFSAEVTGKEIQSPFRVEATMDPTAPSSHPADPHQPPSTAHPAAQTQQGGPPQHIQGQPAGPSRKRPKSASPAPALAASQVCSHRTN